MRLPSMRTGLSLRPIAHYALLLFFVLVVALGVFAAFVFHDVSHLKEQAALSDEKLARQELEEAVALLARQAESAAQALVQWDEARQQLENPVYYAYWRNSRAFAAGVLPETEILDAVDLYDLQGANLSPVTVGEASMPAHIATQRLQPYLVRESSHDHLYFFFPFYLDDRQTQMAGYAGLKFDFQQGLEQLRKFRYLDLASVHVVAREGERIPLHEIVSSLQFRTTSNPEMRALEKPLRPLVL